MLDWTQEAGMDDERQAAMIHLSAFLPKILLWNGYGAGPGMMWYGFGVLGWLMMIAIWVLVVAGLIYLVRWLARPSNRGGQETALDLLKKRYAKGEISKEEFEEKKKDIQ
ncbi:MAG: SHOCT domain-containing protein [Nitrospiraceae bacterium]|nr:SHOCT domain-containing protein [Nitrospiraceae bacterium]